MIFNDFTSNFPLLLLCDIVFQLMEYYRRWLNTDEVFVNHLDTRKYSLEKSFEKKP
jgi:hypothetical protein